MQTPSFLLAFGAGVLSFMTPCCLPIFPSFLSYVTGVSLDELSAGTRAVRSRMLAHSLAFFVGFSTIYVAMGLVTSALADFFTFGRCMARVGTTCIGLPQIGGLVVVVLGLSLLGVLRIPFLIREHRFRMADRPEGLLGSVLIGLTFAAGWTPCTGPILGAVITLASRHPGQGAPLLFAYSIGFAVPFLILAYALGSVRALARYSTVLERVGGGLMVATGLLLATGKLEQMSAWLIQVTGFQGF